MARGTEEEPPNAEPAPLLDVDSGAPVAESGAWGAGIADGAGLIVVVH
jgi:hypothetical protein